MPACFVLLGGVGISACGASDFANEPRAAIPYETTASIGQDAVNVSPARFGAGITVITVANLTTDPASFTLKGPTEASSGTIQPSSVTTIKTTLAKGTYHAIAKGLQGVKPATLTIGPKRKSSQNQVLQP
jgi:hypothetical protein